MTKSTSACAERLSSGNDPAGVFSWLIMPIVIGSPVAGVGSSGTRSAIDDAVAQSSRCCASHTISGVETVVDDADRSSLQAAAPSTTVASVATTAAMERAAPFNPGPPWR